MTKEAYIKPEVEIEVLEPHAIGGFLSGGVPGTSSSTTNTSD